MASRTPTGVALEARYHQHPGQEHGHLHRRGNSPHTHDDDGRPVFAANGVSQPRDPATGQFLAKREADTIALRRPDLISADALIADVDQRLTMIDDLADRAADNISLEPGLVDLAVQSFDREVEMFAAAVGRLGDLVLERSRFMVLAAAAQTQGHHPAAAYCFVADRLDPVGAGS